MLLKAFRVFTLTQCVNNSSADRQVQSNVACLALSIHNLQAGAMRLGRDVLVLTQTTNSRSLAFL
ncbi:hypothetical protein glysoja_030724 [Glycine soja]|uniref:Uncharacterized protein n=1 Tax=Glycine soja TaxID=3848 RepID=A0A0B2SNZ8_GLYSO|nr:hypothetical protein glysoja_030724 [Glycine soja]